MKTYTAQVGPDNAARLAALGQGTDGRPIVEDIGEGTIAINDLDRLRAREPDSSASITDDEDGLQIWVDGEGYPVFDELDAAVADALGMESEYLEAKRTFDQAAALRDAAVRKAVGLAGSPAAAAALLGMDEPAVTAIVSSDAVAGGPRMNPAG